MDCTFQATIWENLICLDKMLHLNIFSRSWEQSCVIKIHILSKSKIVNIEHKVFKLAYFLLPQSELISGIYSMGVESKGE